MISGSNFIVILCLLNQIFPIRTTTYNLNQNITENQSIYEEIIESPYFIIVIIITPLIIMGYIIIIILYKYHCENNKI